MNTYIGRGSPFGNPFKISDYGSRDIVISMYEQYLRGSPELLARLGELKSKFLGCFCVPQACHGEVLLRVLDELS